MDNNELIRELQIKTQTALINADTWAAANYLRAIFTLAGEDDNEALTLDTLVALQEVTGFTRTVEASAFPPAPSQGINCSAGNVVLGTQHTAGRS